MSKKRGKSTTFAVGKTGSVGMGTFSHWIGIIGLIAVLTACSQPERTQVADIPLSDSSTRFPQIPLRAEQATIGNVAIAVDHSLEPLIQAEVETFMALNQRAYLRPAYLPGEAAIAAMLASDTMRLAISTRKLTAEETQILTDEQIIPDYTIIGYEGVALLSHPTNPDSVISLEEIKRIMTGKVKDWKELSPTGVDAPLQVVFDQRQSGLMRFFQDSVLGGTPVQGENLFALDHSEAVVEYVSTHPGALGVIGWAWLSDDDDPITRSLKSKVRVVLVDAPSNSELCPYNQTRFGPYQSFIATRCYAFTRPIMIIRREVFHGLGTGFISFLVSYSGQRIIHKAGLAAVKGIPREVQFPPKEGAKDIE